MSLREVLIDELRDLYSAENQVIKQMPKTAKATSSPELKQIFLQHLEETKGQVERLKQIFEILGKKPTGKHCSGMEGAIEEVKEALEEDDEKALKDAGIIGAAARVEHYEIAGYTASVLIAKQLGQHQVVSLLMETLEEEKKASKDVLSAAKTILKQAFLQERDDQNKPDKKPKNAKEKKSEQESNKDEKDAAKELGKSPEEAMTGSSEGSTESEGKSAKGSDKQSSGKKNSTKG